MNDFTKEELELIINKFSLLIFSQFEGCGALTMKIQSMIDNYCAHEFVFTLYDSKVHCHKCKRGLSDNK